MVKVKEIKENPNCVASITVRVTKSAKSTIEIDGKQYKISTMFNTSNTKSVS
jgi:hypothetical protein